MADEETTKIFNRIDTNNDGLISIDELQTLMTTLSNNPSTDQTELNKIMEEIDNDKNGYIDLKEFYEFQNRETTSCKDDEELKAAFEMYDKDKNGVISARELHAVMMKLGEKCTVKDCTMMIKSVDGDGDGFVNFEEFKKMMKP